jgi:hypothetical protein
MCCDCWHFCNCRCAFAQTFQYSRKLMFPLVFWCDIEILYDIRTGFRHWVCLGVGFLLSRSLDFPPGLDR